MTRRFVLVAGAAGVVAALTVFVGIGLHTARAEGPADLKGKPSPNFTLKTTLDKEVTLSQLKGDVVVIDFWATWCPPCRASLPHIQKLASDQNKIKQGLHVLAVNCSEGKNDIEPFLKKNDFTFMVPMDSDGKVQQQFGVQGIPTTVVVGRDGVVRAVFVGFSSEEGGKGVDEAVEAALKEK